MLTVKNLSKHFGKIKAVDNIDFSIDKCEIVGFLGPNGAGKTTTMRLITGFLSPNSGTISINDQTPKQARSIIGYLPEENPLYDQLTPLEYLMFIGRMHSMDKGEILSQMDYVIKKSSIQPVLNQKIETLSRGFRQRVGLAATLIHDPEIIIMDEPTSGLDPNQQAEIKKLIQKLAEDKAVIFSTHILSEAESVCQRVLIIHQGRIVGRKDLSDLKTGELNRIFTKLTT